MSPEIMQGKERQLLEHATDQKREAIPIKLWPLDEASMIRVLRVNFAGYAGYQNYAEHN